MDVVELTRALVRIPSWDPMGTGEAEVAERLRDPLEQAGLATQVLRSPGGRPSLVATLDGPTDRPPLVLLSHLDVVPVEESRWRHDPFGGEIHDGQLWGRGSIDMKGVSAMHAHAVTTFARTGATRSRRVVLLSVADEETGGAEGAGWLLDTHPELCGFVGRHAPDVLGEGAFGLTGLLDRPVLPSVVGEKVPLWVRATAEATPGHGSMPPADQAVRAISWFVETVAGHGRPRRHPVVRELFGQLAARSTGPRAAVLRLLASEAGDAVVRLTAPALRGQLGALGHLLADSITPTRLDAGYATNVVPGRASADLDVRLLPDTDSDRFLARLERVARRRGVELEVLQRHRGAVSRGGEVADAIAQVSTTLPGAPIAVRSLTPGTTDLRFFRVRGARGYGWVPVLLSPEQLAGFHSHDERIPVAGLRDGAEAFATLVHRVAC